MFFEKLVRFNDATQFRLRASVAATRVRVQFLGAIAKRARHNG